MATTTQHGRRGLRGRQGGGARARAARHGHQERGAAWRWRTRSSSARPTSSRPTRATWRPAARPASHAGAARPAASSTEERLAAIAADVRAIAALPDPVGETIEGHRLENGLDVRRVRMPLGVVAVVYEARPERDHRLLGAVPQVGQRDRAARVVDGGPLERVLAQVAASAVAVGGAARRARSRSSPAATATSCARSPPRTGWST